MEYLSFETKIEETKVNKGGGGVKIDFRCDQACCLTLIWHWYISIDFILIQMPNDTNHSNFPPPPPPPVCKYSVFVLLFAGEEIMTFHRL